MLKNHDGVLKRDFLWILIVSILILIWSSLPTWAGYRAETSELRFRGIYNDSQDYAAHISMMEAGAQGEWAYQFRFTSEPMRFAYVRLFYIVLGHFSYWLELGTEQMFDLARWLLGFSALFSLYWLTRYIFQELFWARVAFLLAAIGSGAGWLQLIFNLTSTAITPIDFWLIDSYVFFSLSVFPHFAFVTTGMCMALVFWLKYIERPDPKYIVWIVLISILVQLTNPIAFATIDAAFFGAVIFTWWNIKKIDLKHLAGLVVIGISQIPILLYNLAVFTQDPLWIQYTSQHQTPSPPVDYYIWGFAPFLPFACLGSVGAFQKRSARLGAFVFWIITAMLLAYAPLYTQQRFLQNITIPLGVLATQGLIIIRSRNDLRKPENRGADNLRPHPYFQEPSGHFLTFREVLIIFFSRVNQRLDTKQSMNSLVLLFVLLTSFSSIQLSLGRANYLQTHPKQYYYPASLDRAVLWLRENAHYNDFVLASNLTSQVLAQRARVRVYSGHEMETINYKNKQENVQAFYRGSFPELAANPVKWVVYGPYEREINYNFKATDNLELVYETQELKIYQVK